MQGVDRHIDQNQLALIQVKNSQVEMVQVWLHCVVSRHKQFQNVQDLYAP